MKSKIAAICVLVIVLSCLYWIWPRHKSAPSAAAVEQTADKILKSRCALNLINSWRTINAAGGTSSKFFDFRPRTDYFLQAEADISVLESMSKELGDRHGNIDFRFFSFADNARLFMPHKASADLAPWWRPETNSEPMLSAQFNDKDIVYIYGFKKSTNALIYIHIIEP